jgi:hypothetical protein
MRRTRTPRRLGKATKEDAGDLWGLVQRLSKATDMILMGGTFLEATAFLNGYCRSDLLRDEFREWLAHGNGLPCKFTWSALTLQLLSKTTVVHRAIDWSPKVKLRFDQLRPVELLIQSIGQGKEAQRAAIQTMCKWIDAFLRWRARLDPLELTRFRRRFTRPHH